MSEVKQSIITLDLEGVLIPEVWINVAEKTGIEELKLTTRDIQDYDELMQHRLKVLEKHNITLSQIQEVIATLKPLEGAKEFLDTLRNETQLIILSDTFREFAKPFMDQLGLPTIFCHSLVIKDDKIVDYKLRQNNQKEHAVKALQSLNYKVIAAGDSFNDTTMLGAADHGFLFKSPDNVAELFPQFPRYTEYDELWAEFKKHIS
ncbi:bifunctional phosphoserine phosphatase/homoserine phosphotransferase ThrH [bacterium]|nr:bifunctional phosphoserine phosphatase/homoserine phosphotransferase ThrH [bacterium]